MTVGSVHSSRTIMLEDLSRVLDAVPADASQAEYREAIVNQNVLGKQSYTTRQKSERYLRQLYTLNPEVPAFRTMRRLWSLDQEGRPLLAMLCAQAHDPVLRATADTVMQTPYGAPFDYEVVSEVIEERFPGVFSFKTLRSMGQNIASSWAQSGHLDGVVKKSRGRANATQGALTYALDLGYRDGHRGSLLFTTDWARTLDRPVDELYALATGASAAGWIDFKKYGDVVDVAMGDVLMGTGA